MKVLTLTIITSFLSSFLWVCPMQFSMDPLGHTEISGKIADRGCPTSDCMSADYWLAFKEVVSSQSGDFFSSAQTVSIQTKGQSDSLWDALFARDMNGPLPPFPLIGTVILRT